MPKIGIHEEKIKSEANIGTMFYYLPNMLFATKTTYQ